jgi:hypothetical protein
LKAHATTAEFRIGNQWTWGSFTMGADWFGIEVPIITNVSQDDGEFSQSNALRSIHLVQFFVGLAF